MARAHIVIWRAALAAACSAAFVQGAKATGCTDLASQPLLLDGVATTVQLTAQDVTGGSFGGVGGLPPFCRVAAVVSSNGNTAQSQIAIETWLPEPGSPVLWNGRLLGTGNGGFAGSISYGPLAIGLLEGFAATNTDMGTGIIFKCNTLYCGDKTGLGGPPGGLYGDAAAIEDFGYGATHLMTLAAKQLVGAYYGQAANHAYFHGCSTGGQQALMEAQRFPADYDGIVAGSPAYDRTHLHIASAAIYQATHLVADAYLTTPALALTHQGVLAQCAGHDGGLATDPYLTQPAQCAFDATSLQCTGSGSDVPCTSQTGTCNCLVPAQAAALNADWLGAHDFYGRVLYPGYERGTEDPTAAANVAFQESGPEPVFDGLDYWAFGPTFNWMDLFFRSRPYDELAGKIATLDHTPVGSSDFAGVLNANSPDLSAFASRGGKLLMYAGYTDPLIPTASSFDYFNAVARTDPAGYAGYLRLFLAPGVWHCGGGPGANAFGNLSTVFPPFPQSPADDVMGALISWREVGFAPEQIVATKYNNDVQADGIAFQRPLCAYPRNAEYKTNEHGSPLLASSYRCAAGFRVRTQNFSPIYGP